MNPYLDQLKSKKSPPDVLPKLTEATCVSNVSANGGPIQKFNTTSVSSVSAYSGHFQEIDLVAEFMEVDGLTLEQAQAVAAISIQPRTPAIWLEMIADLNSLINAYCASAKVSNEAKQRIRAASYSQSLASIPHAINWFRAELRALESDRTG
jgi:hypothetical protein